MAEKQQSDPHLIRDGNLERCSECGYPFPADVKPSMSVAFAEHLMKAHRPGQISEDVNRAPRARETTQANSGDKKS